MITIKEWHEFLYECELIGQQWLHVNRVGYTYLAWRAGWKVTPFDQAQAMMDALIENPKAGEEILAQYLAEPQYGSGAVRAIIPEEIRQRITKMLHLIVNEKPNPKDWVN